MTIGPFFPTVAVTDSIWGAVKQAFETRTIH